MLDLQILVEAYARYASSNDPADFWAWDRVGQIVRGQDPEAAFELVRQLVRAVPEDRLGYVGAGPLEDFVKQHGSALADWIVGEAGRDPRFRAALASIWLIAEDLPPGVIQRLQTATEGHIKVATRADLDAVQLPIPPSKPR
jgi:hypothetical protein